MDDVALLKLQVAWGADEALAALPRNRLVAAALPPQPESAPAVPLAALPSAALRVAPIGAVARAEALAGAAGSVAELRAALAGFSDCPLQSTAIHLVFADGNAASGLMVIGDVPGEDEDRSGRPFSGPSGQLLDRMLASIGLNRGGALLTTVIPWRPPGSRKPTDHERQLCLPFLRRHIALVAPRRLLLLGTAATASLVPGATTALKRLRGQWQQVTIPGLAPPVAALPTFGPDHLIATPLAKREAWSDLLALRQALDQDGKARPTRPH